MNNLLVNSYCDFEMEKIEFNVPRRIDQKSIWARTGNDDEA